MAIICREILKLPSMKKLEVLAGAKGMDNTLRWFYIAECFEDPREVVDWLFGGELVFITGRNIRGNNEILVELVEKISEKNISGLVINVGPYIPEIPEAVIQLAERLSLPLFKLPWESKLVEITREICSLIISKEMEEKSLDNLLENILFSDSDIDENLIDRAAYFGYDLTGGCQVCILDIDRFVDFLKQQEIKDENSIVDIKNNLKRIVQEVLVKNNKCAFSMLRSDSVIFLDTGLTGDSKVLEKMFEEIRGVAQKKLHGLTVSAGVGNIYHELQDMRKSLKEAEQALKIAKLSNIKNIAFYNKLGVYSLLLSGKDTQVIEKYYNDELGQIVEYDRLNSTELLKTLEMLLNESGNITTTSEKLYIHRNTLKYRIQKIEEILGCDLRLLQDMIRLEIGLMIGKLLNYN